MRVRLQTYLLTLITVYLTLAYNLATLYMFLMVESHSGYHTGILIAI